MSAGKRKNEKAVGDGVKLRQCLRCDKDFMSYSHLNRICLDCKKSPEFTRGIFSERGEEYNGNEKDCSGPS